MTEYNMKGKEILTGDEAKELMKSISEYRLPKDIDHFIKKYEDVGGHRNGFLWKWVYAVLKDTGVTFSSVEEKYFIPATGVKTILTMFVSLIDDISDYLKDKKLLNEALKILFDADNVNADLFSYEEKKYILFSKEVWNYVKTNITRYPRYKEFEDIFNFDLNQLLNSFYHSFLINKNNDLINLTEEKNYGSHNMVVFIYSVIDLMISPDFDRNELPWLREIIWRSQQMARIGNWLSTWERELKEKDFSSAVFGYAIINNIVTLAELKNGANTEMIAEKIKNSDYEKYFFDEWKRCYNEIKELSSNIKTIDIGVYLSGLKTLLKLHLASKGLK